MKTEINWLNPNETTPPFNKRILVLLGGSGSDDCCKTVTPYVHFCDVVIKKTSPNDEDANSEYCEFYSPDNEYKYTDYQFHVCYWHDHRFGADDDLDWYSDAIVRWAEMPDFSETLSESN